MQGVCNTTMCNTIAAQVGPARLQGARRCDGLLDDVVRLPPGGPPVRRPLHAVLDQLHDGRRALLRHLPRSHTTAQGRTQVAKAACCGPKHCACAMEPREGQTLFCGPIIDKQPKGTASKASTDMLKPPQMKLRLFARGQHAAGRGSLNRRTRRRRRWPRRGTSWVHSVHSTTPKENMSACAERYPQPQHTKVQGPPQTFKAEWLHDATWQSADLVA